MRLQSLVAMTVLALVFTTPGLVSAEPMFFDFSTDPQLATEWTATAYYNPLNAANTVSWDSTAQNLSVAATSGSESMKLIMPNGATWDNANPNPVTMDISDVSPGNRSGWMNLGVVISSVTNPVIGGVAHYRFNITTNYGNYRLVCLKNGNVAVGSQYTIGTTLPAVTTLSVVRDGLDYVFKYNDTEIYRDQSYDTQSLPYYGILWGAGRDPANTFTAKVDNFGVVPEPSTLVLLAAGLLGLLCYAWKKRK